MLIKRNAEYSYLENHISEENGWKVWYDWKIVKKHTSIINIFITILLAVTSMVYRDFFAANGIANLLISLGAALLIWLVVITPIHEVLHLIPYAGFKCDDKCIITIGKGTVSAIYNGKISKTQFCMSILLPVVVLTVLIVPIFIFSDSNLKVFTTLLLILNLFGSYTDVYMFFYALKLLKKNDTIFGRYSLAEDE